MSATRWHNPLPPWIRADLALRPLRQGLRATLQTIADRCDRAGGDEAPLLVCLGGKDLVRDCGCSASTFWQHEIILIERGYVVPLSRGAGRLASVYGIAGQRGQLDSFRVGPNDGPRRWTQTDSKRIRRLVSENRILADAKTQPSENGRAAVRESEGSLPEIERQPAGNRTLPSSTPSPVPAPLPDKCVGSALADDDARVLLARLNDLHFGTHLERSRLVREDPQGLRKALANLDEAVAQGVRSGCPIRSPAGLLRTLLENKPGGLVTELARSMSAKPPLDLEAHRRKILRQADELRKAGSRQAQVDDCLLPDREKEKVAESGTGS